MSNRSGSPYSTPRDANRVPFLTAASTADGITPVVLEADPTTHLLQVSSSGGGGGGTQYTDGSSTIAHPIGTIPVYDKAGTITAVSVANGLPSTITDGTNIANVLKSDGTAAGQNAQLVGGTYLSVPFTTTTVQAVGTTDAGNYNYVSVHTTTQGTSSNIIFQGSNDNTNWVSVVLLITSATGSTSQNISTSGAARIDSGPLNFRYFRLNVTGISAGTTAGTIIFRTQAPPMIAQSTQVGSNSAIGSAVPANAFYLGLYNNGSLTGWTNARLVGDAHDGTGQAMVSSSVFNGTSFDRTRSANGASNTTGTGLLGAGNLGYDGTNWQSIGAVAGDAGFNGLAVASATKSYTFTTSASGAQTILADTKVEGYSWIDIVYTSVGTGLALNGQFSPSSGGTYYSAIFNWSAGNYLAPISALGTTVNIIYSGPVKGNYFQIAVSALTSGTFTGTVTLRANAPPNGSMNAISTQNGPWNVGTASAVVNVGQQTSNTSAVQLSASSTIPTNGIVIEALIANAAVVYIGGSGVTTSTGFQLSPGQSLTLTCNLNTIYVIGSNATDKVCWSVA